MSEPNLVPKLEEGQLPCGVCAAPVWRAHFAKADWRLVEKAPPHRFALGKVWRTRLVGRVALTFPLAGMGGTITGHIVRQGTTFRLHVCKAFSAARSSADRKASTRPELIDVVKLGGGK
jgi:hypothetical protein